MIRMLNRLYIKLYQLEWKVTEVRKIVKLIATLTKIGLFLPIESNQIRKISSSKLLEEIKNHWRKMNQSLIDYKIPIDNCNISSNFSVTIK